MANIFHVERTANKITLGTTGTTINVPPLTASLSLGLDASKNLESVDLSGIYQPLDAVLTDLSALDVVADNEFIVGTGAGVYVHESGATVRTSMGLGNVENTKLSTWAGTTNITTLGTIATVGNITIAENGTIGQAAGPLLTFDDTSNRLKLTGSLFQIISSTQDTFWVEVNNDTDWQDPTFSFRRSRGTYAVKTVVVEGDELGTFNFRGYDGANYEDAAKIIAFVDGEPASGGDLTDMPGRLCFLTTPNGSDASAIRMTIKSDGKVNVGSGTPKTLFTIEGALTLKEQAAADTDNATYGQVWVKNDTPNTLWFTDDAGTDHQIAFV